MSFTPPAAGYWCFSGHYSGIPQLRASADTSTDECFHVTQTSSATATAPSVTTEVYSGDLLFDTATVTGTAAAFPAGDVQFYECGPTANAVACNSTNGTPLSLDQTSKLSASQGIANSSGFTPTSAGNWCFAGYYLGNANYTASADATIDECVNVTLAPTSTTSKPTNTSIDLGQANTDLATVSTGDNTAGSPTGTVSFYECGPTSTPTACKSTAHRVGGPVTVSPKAGSTATATSPSFKPTAVGYWCFAARYSGDGGLLRQHQHRGQRACQRQGSGGDRHDVPPAGQVGDALFDHPGRSRRIGSGPLCLVAHRCPAVRRPHERCGRDFRHPEEERELPHRDQGQGFDQAGNHGYQEFDPGHRLLILQSPVLGIEGPRLRGLQQQ